MYSATDFEKLWFLYKTDGHSKGVSIHAYCSMRGVSSKPFYDWLRKRQKSIVPVQIEGSPSCAVGSSEVSVDSDSVHEEVHSQVSGGIAISIHTHDGLHIRKNNLDYLGVKRLIEKLEGLC